MAGALLVVGCQNYDDQFSNLESQINALASTVAGLSQVQSDLSSLSGTVSSLSSTVAALGSQFDTAVSDGLADITADIAALQAALDGVATSSDLDAVAASVASQQASLDELLANSSVFNGAITINNSATLDAFHGMGSTLAIVNGSVDIDVDTTMDIKKVQEVVDNIMTVTGSYSYNAGSTVTGVTFNKLSATATLTIEQADGYELKALSKAGVVTLHDTYENKVDIVDLRNLSSVTSLSDGTTAHTLDFTQAAEIHLTKIGYYGNNLTIKSKKGGVVDLSALNDTNTSGIVTPFTLTLHNAKSFTSTLIKGDAGAATASRGYITLTDVATVNISNFGGNITLNGGVVTATLEDVASDVTLSSADDLTTLSIEGVTDYGKTYDALSAASKAEKLYTAAFIDVALTSANTDLESVTITGKVDDLSISGVAGLSTVVVNADVNTLTLSTNVDLTSVTTTGSKINSTTVTGNTDLTALTLDNTTYTTVVASTGTADAKGDLAVYSNANLASLTVNTTALNNIDIYSNAKLETVNFPNLVAAGTGTNADIDIYSNKLTATSVTDNYDQTSANVAIVTGTTDDATNTGSYTSTSGLKSLQTWLDAVLTAGTTATLAVWFDVIDEVKTVSSAGVITTTNPGTKSTAYSATYAGELYAAVYKRPVTTAVSTMDNAVGNEARTYVFDLIRDGLGGAIGLADGEGFALTYAASGSVSFTRSGTSRTTVADLVSYMDSYDLSAANLDIESSLDSAERYIYTVNYGHVTNGVTTAGTVSAAGSVNFTYGNTLAGTSQLMSFAVVAGDIDIDLAEGARNLIDGLADFNATSITTGANAYKSFYVTRDVSGTDSVDRSPLMAAAPALNWVIDAAMTSTTAILGKNDTGFLTASHLSNTFAGSRISLANITPSLQSNLRITIKGTNGQAMYSALTLTAASQSASNTAITVGTMASGELSEYLLVDGVNIVSATSNGSSGTSDITATTYYVAGSGDISEGTENIQTAGVTAISTDRTGWLG